MLLKFPASDLLLGATPFPRALCSKAENFDFLRRADDGNTAVEVGNPATFEFEVCRSTLLPSALKTLGANKDAALPVKLFEVRLKVREEMDLHMIGVLSITCGVQPLGCCDILINTNAALHRCHYQVSDVILLSPTHDVGARNERRLVAIYSNKESGFEVVHGMLNRVMEVLGVPYKGEHHTLAGTGQFNQL